MGTRNLTAVFYKGEYRIAQYGQWDGYPEGQGMTALKFLRERMNRPEFERALLNIEQITDGEIKNAWIEAGADPFSDFVTPDVSRKFREIHPELSRDTGAEILEIVQNHPDGIKLNLDLAFAAESLFCEWAWVIDLDAGTFEGYEGFNESRELTEEDRFYFLRDKESDGYHGVVLAGKWSLDALPTPEEFLDYFSVNEDEDEEEDQ